MFAEFLFAPLIYGKALTAMTISMQQRLNPMNFEMRTMFQILLVPLMPDRFKIEFPRVGFRNKV